MRRAATFAILLVSLCAGCKTGPAETGRTSDPAQRPDPPKEGPKMTDLDPKSPAAWMQAEALAATAAKGKLTKRSDALPFLFTSTEPPGAVLVHKGKVVRDRGAKVAGEYLRDLGIIEGKGPPIDDVLVVLKTLDAWPPVSVPKESYVHAPGDQALADLTAQVYFDGVTATVTLVYFLSGPLMPGGGSGPAAPGDTVGGMDPDYKPKPYRKIARCTLTIPKTGDPAWTVENLNHSE